MVERLTVRLQIANNVLVTVRVLGGEGKVMRDVGSEGRFDIETDYIRKETRKGER